METSPNTTSSFPPNPEDGELWLPSYLCREIALPNVKKTTAAAAIATTTDVTPQPPIFHHASKKKQVRAPLHSVKSNVKPTIGNGQPCVDHPYNYHFVDPPSQFGPFYQPNPIISSNQFLGYNRRIPSGRKSEGTGVFLPGSSKTVTKKESEVVGLKGRGVFHHNNQLMVNPQKGGENGKVGMEKISSLKEEMTEKTEEPYDQICLPKDWPY